MAEQGKKARTPEYVRQMTPYQEARKALAEAWTSSREVKGGIKDEATAASVAQVATRVSKAIKFADKKRLEATEPYRNSTAVINNEFNEMLNKLKAVDEWAREELKKYNARKRKEAEDAQRKHEEEVCAAEKAQREAEEAARRAAEEAAKKNEPPPPPPEPAPAPSPPPPPVVEPGKRVTADGAISPRIEWKFEVFDPALVPAQFKVIDESAIRKAVKEGTREIPGVRIYPDENIQIR